MTILPHQKLETDVCVIGGGSGGIGAAITAARLGARVVLVDRDAWLGGTTTNGGVSVWQPSVCCDALCREIFDRTRARGVSTLARAGLRPGATMPVKRDDPAAVYCYSFTRMIPWTPQFCNGYVIGFDPAGFDATIREMLDETGCCRVLDQTTVTGVEVGAPGKLTQVIASRGPDTLSISAHQFVDCTGDVEVARMAGVTTRCGEDPKALYGEPGAPQEESPRLNGVTLMYAIGREPGLARPGDCEEYRGGAIHGSADIAELPGDRFSVNNCFMISGDEAYAMGLDRAYEVLSRRIWLYWDLTRSNYGLDGYNIVWVAPRLGLREGPRIVGRYVLTEHDIRAGMKGQRHEDIVAVTSHAMDTHGTKSYCLEGPNGPFGIPFRCLQTNELENLLVACRGASFSHLAASAARLQRTMIEIGVAAGKAAAGANPVPPREHWDY